MVPRHFLVPFCMVTSLFFIWGFARSILDVLNKHFQETLHISIERSMMVQASTYAAYALMALPAGMVISRWGYRRGLVLGLAVFAAGCFMFIPGAAAGSFTLFLTALFVIGCGLASLETAANPYAAELGPASTAASRLNLAQSFNGLGSMLGPVTVGGILFSHAGASVAIPYTVMGIAVSLLAVAFTRVKLPELHASGVSREAKTGFWQSSRTIWRHSAFRCGIAALFCYEAAEIGINSIFINYVTADGWMDRLGASAVLSFGALGLFMAARVAGSGLMRGIAPARVLAVCAAGALAASVCVALGGSSVCARIGLFGCYAFEAIMFPTVFAMTVSSVGPHAKTASAYLMMSPLGGALGAWLMGLAASSHMSGAFWVAAGGYLATGLLGWKLSRPPHRPTV